MVVEQVAISFMRVNTIYRPPAAVPEFRSVVGDENASSLSAALEASNGKGSSDACREALRKCLTAIMTKDSAEMASQLEALITRLKAEGRIFDSHCSRDADNHASCLRFCVLC